jgi:hypothetical protein
VEAATVILAISGSLERSSINSAITVTKLVGLAVASNAGA